MTYQRDDVNWPEVQRRYESGEGSIREIANQFNVTRQAIQWRAKNHNWEKPKERQVSKPSMAQRIRAKTERKATQIVEQDAKILSDIEDRLADKEVSKEIKDLKAKASEVDDDLEALSFTVNGLMVILKKRIQIQVVAGVPASADQLRAYVGILKEAAQTKKLLEETKRLRTPQGGAAKPIEGVPHGWREPDETIEEAIAVLIRRIGPRGAGERTDSKSVSGSSHDGRGAGGAPQNDPFALPAGPVLPDALGPQEE